MVEDDCDVWVAWHAAVSAAAVGPRPSWSSWSPPRCDSGVLLLGGAVSGESIVSKVGVVSYLQPPHRFPTLFHFTHDGSTTVDDESPGVRRPCRHMEATEKMGGKHEVWVGKRALCPFMNRMNLLVQDGSYQGIDAIVGSHSADVATATAAPSLGGIVVLCF